MNISVNYERLEKILTACANTIDCLNCPMYDSCLESKQVYDCIDVYMNYIKEKENN